MRGDVKIAVVLMLLAVESTRGSYYSMLGRLENLLDMCNDTPTDISNNNHMKSCCQRGCRFFNLEESRSGYEPRNLSNIKYACKASCTEAYNNLEDRYACSTGCDSMAKRRFLDVLFLYTASISLSPFRADFLGLSPDMPDEVLIDSGLRKEMLYGWDVNEFKLPQTYIKTMPVDSGSVDYTLSSDYSGENEQTGSSLDLLLRQTIHYITKKQIKIPFWDRMLPFWSCACFVVVVLSMGLLVTMVYLSRQEDMIYNKLFDSKSNSLKDFMSDEVPLWKEPPPKYDELLDEFEI